MSGRLSKVMAESCIMCDRLWNDLVVLASAYVKAYRRYRHIARRSNFPGTAALSAELQQCHALRRIARNALRKHERTHPAPQFAMVGKHLPDSRTVIASGIHDENKNIEFSSELKKLNV